jgi:hypothetical protein
MFALVASFSACGQKKVEITEESPAVQSVVVTGTIDCMACDLKHSAGVSAECKIYGHDHSLKVQQVTTASGNPINVSQGTWYHILPNDNSKTLVQEETYHGKKVKINGKLYASANLLEVDTFNLIEK